MSTYKYIWFRSPEMALTFVPDTGIGIVYGGAIGLLHDVALLPHR